MSILGNIKGFFVNIWHLLKPEEQALLQAFEAKITPDILAAARAGITVAVEAGLHDTAARDTAISTAINNLKAIGQDVVDFSKSEWNALIEILYTAQQPATAAAPVVAEPTPVEEPAATEPETPVVDEPAETPAATDKAIDE